jgi:hypothetical protein
MANLGSSNKDNTLMGKKKQAAQLIVPNSTDRLRE